MPPGTDRDPARTEPRTLADPAANGGRGPAEVRARTLAQHAREAAAALRRRPAHLALAALSAGLASAAVAPDLATALAALAALALLAATAAAGRGAAIRGVLATPATTAAAGRGAAVRGVLAAPATTAGARRRGAWLLALLALAVGALVGEARLGSIDRFGARVHDGAALAAPVQMLEHPRPGPLGASVEVRVVAGPLRGARLLARLPRWAGALDGVPIGAELRVRGRLRSLARIAVTDATRELQVAAWLRRRGVAGELLLDRARPTGRRRGGLAGLLDRVRDRAERAVDAGLRADRAALLRGMVLGQDQAIDEHVRDEFEAAGLAHILAVSGQNVMLLAALALPALTAAGLGAYGRAAALLALIALYVPLAGAGPSLQRAGVMGAAAIAAMLATRPASRSYALLLAAAATLLLNPRGVAAPGWQLSFAAVAGILAIGRPLARTLRDSIHAASGPTARARPPGSAPSPRSDASASSPRSDASVSSPWSGASVSSPRSDASAPMPPPALGARLRRSALKALADGLAITVAATLATAPLLAHHFGTVSLASLPANLLALPVVAPAMWLGMLKAAAGQLALAGLPGDAAARALGALAQLPVAAIAILAERFAALPGGQARLPLRSPLAVAGAYALLTAVVGIVRFARLSLVARAGEAGARWRRRSPRARAATTALVAAVVALVAAEELAPPRPPEALTIRFLDVGQGDATLVQHPDGTAILFDGGPPEGGVARQLRRAGVRRLALVVATHASRDHHGGLASVLAELPVELLLDGGDGTADRGFRALAAAADRRGIRRVAAVAPLRLRVGELRVRILSPPPRPSGPPPEDPNPRAVTAVVSAGELDLLLSADAESPTLATLPLPDVDVLKLPHHGSADPGLPDLLDRLRPEAAAITVGTNTYGHPAPSTLSALREAGVPTWRTDRDGTITMTVAGDELHVDTER